MWIACKNVFHIRHKTKRAQLIAEKACWMNWKMEVAVSALSCGEGLRLDFTKHMRVQSQPKAKMVKENPHATKEQGFGLGAISPAVF